MEDKKQELEEMLDELHDIIDEGGSLSSAQDAMMDMCMWLLGHNDDRPEIH